MDTSDGKNGDEGGKAGGWVAKAVVAKAAAKGVQTLIAV